jgi:hypothetical protein
MGRLFLAWLAALGVVVGGLVVDAVLVLAVARHVENWPLGAANVLLVHAPWVLTILLATVIAVRLHRALVAALAVPALVIVLSVAVGAARGTVAGGLLAAVETAAAAVLAWWLTRRRSQAEADSYFAH